MVICTCHHQEACFFCHRTTCQLNQFIGKDMVFFLFNKPLYTYKRKLQHSFLNQYLKTKSCRRQSDFSLVADEKVK